MSSKKSNSQGMSRTSVVGAVLIFALFVITVALYGFDAAVVMLEDLTGTDFGLETSAGDAGGQPAVDSSGVAVGEGEITVYFTSPVIPFNDVTSGGIEDNLIELINNAESSIDLAVFEFNLQNVAEALIAAHQRGVQVRVVHDDEHTEEDPQIEELMEAGIPAIPDERSAFMHNKFFVFDREIVWTGSTNITENGIYRNNNNALVLRSPQLAANYTAEFEEMFADEFGPRSPANTPNPVVELSGIRIETYFAPEDDPILQMLEVVNGAQSSIHFMTFAFTRDDLGQAIVARGQAGVNVQGLFEQRGAATEFSECNLFLNNGFNVAIDGNPRTLHHKVLIIDSQIVVTGSFNYSDNAVESNDENVLIIYDQQVAQLYEQEFQRRFAESQATEATVCRVP
ncbi:MAG: phospholipase [Chloroflexi bacterium]|nr:phospholipase [Chloroflexota bacterium]